MSSSTDMRRAFRGEVDEGAAAGRRGCCKVLTRPATASNCSGGEPAAHREVAKHREDEQHDREGGHPDPGTHAEARAPRGGRCPAPGTSGPAQPHDGDERDQGHEDEVAAGCAEEVAVAEVVDCAQAATPRAVETGHRIERAVAPAS